MNDLEGFQKLRQDSADGIVDDDRTLAAADDQKYGLSAVKPQKSRAFQPVSFEKLLNGSVSRSETAFTIRNVADGLKESCSRLWWLREWKLVCQTRSQIGFMDHDRNMTMLRCHDNGNRHEASFGKDNAGLQFFHQPDGLSVSFDYTEGIAEILISK